MNWRTTQWNKGVVLKPSAGSEFKFAFPSDDDHVNLIECPLTGSGLRKSNVLHFNYRIQKRLLSLPPKFKSLDSSAGLAPNFRPMLMADTSDWGSSDNRWWPCGTNCAFLICNGDVTLDFTLRPNEWQNVWGTVSPSAFLAFLPKVKSVFLAFGGGNSFSHGVTLTRGSVVFKLNNFAIL